MQFMNSSLEKLVKNLADDDFKYLTEEFVSENLELLKQKDAYPYEYMDSFTSIQDRGRQKGSPYQFFPCNFYKHWNYPQKPSDF